MGMESSGAIPGPEWVAELGKIAGALGDEALRRSFKADPRGSLEKAGVDMSMVPSSIVDVLSGMSVDELAALMRFNDVLVRAGLVVEPPGGYPDGGRVGFF